MANFVITKEANLLEPNTAAFKDRIEMDRYEFNKLYPDLDFSNNYVLWLELSVFFDSASFRETGYAGKVVLVMEDGTEVCVGKVKLGHLYSNEWLTLGLADGRKISKKAIMLPFATYEQMMSVKSIVVTWTAKMRNDLEYRRYEKYDLVFPVKSEKKHYGIRARGVTLDYLWEYLEKNTVVPEDEPVVVEESVTEVLEAIADEEWTEEFFDVDENGDFVDVSQFEEKEPEEMTAEELEQQRVAAEQARLAKEAEEKAKAEAYEKKKIELVSRLFDQRLEEYDKVFFINDQLQGEPLIGDVDFVDYDAVLAFDDGVKRIENVNHLKSSDEYKASDDLTFECFVKTVYLEALDYSI